MAVPVNFFHLDKAILDFGVLAAALLAAELP